ncbi:MAG: hypothetical protein Fur0032_19750 [Terrimicrobiaceae bacterium]
MSRSAKSQTPLVLRPDAGGWQLWSLPPKAEPRLLEDLTIRRAETLTVAVPTKTLLSLPLWIAPEGDARELVELEFSSRHLTRRGQTAYAVEIHREADRALVLGILPFDEDSIKGKMLDAPAYEAPARLIDPQGADIVLWREEDVICMAFFRDGRCAYFASTGEKTLGLPAASAILRCSLRLEAEEVLSRPPIRALLAGNFPPDEEKTLQDLTGWETVTTQLPPPRLPADQADLAPPAVIEHRSQRSKTRRLTLIVGIASVIYLAVVATLTAIYMLKAFTVRDLQAETRQQQPLADAARDDVLRWQAIRPAVDPESFALDQLAAIARSLPGDTVRLTQVVSGNGRILLSGEAGDVSQSYQMLEKLKTEPALEDYEWTARQPDIAGRNTIRFEFEGRRPDASTDTE